MNPEEQIKAMEDELRAERIKRMNTETQIQEMSGFTAGKEPNIIEYQLDVSPTLDRIYHLLSGHILVKKTNGGEDWEEPDDDRLKILSDYGVKQIMNLLSFYINPNTLLSNFDEDTIKWKVRDFGIELSDLIFNRYEAFFFYPTPEELFEQMTNTIVNNPKKFSYFIKQGIDNDGILEINEVELYNKCIQWSREELQMKFRHFPMLVQVLVDTVHATLLRALRGMERESLRKQLNIHQNLNGPQFPDYNQQNKTGLFSRWGR